MNGKFGYLGIACLLMLAIGCSHNLPESPKHDLSSLDQILRYHRPPPQPQIGIASPEEVEQMVMTRIDQLRYHIQILENKIGAARQELGLPPLWSD